MLDFLALAQACAPTVHADTLNRIVAIESGFNPNAIGVVGARLARQPRTRTEALVTAEALQAAGHNFSVGLAQVNRQHFVRFGLSLADAFEPCTNLRTGAAILGECFARARHRDEQSALRAAFSCYYSGNFRTGFDHGYVQKVVAARPPSSPAAIAVPKLIATPSDAQPARGRSPRASKRGARSDARHDAAAAAEHTPGDTAASRSALIF